MSFSKRWFEGFMGGRLSGKGQWVHDSIRTLWVVTLTVLLSLVFILLAPIPVGFKRRIERFWSKSLLWASGIRVESYLEGPLDLPKGVILIANHQSYLDIPILIATSPVPLRFIAKRELVFLPFFGIAMVLNGHILIKRETLGSLKGLLGRLSSPSLAQESFAVFPEGTRSKDGKIHPFKAGPFFLAKALGKPVLPVLIQGSRALMPKGSRLIRSGNVAVIYGSPFEPVGPPKRIAQEMPKILEGLLAPTRDPQASP